MKQSWKGSLTDVQLTSFLLYLSNQCPSPSQSLEDGVSSSSTMGVCRDVEAVVFWGVGLITVGGVGALDVEGDGAFGNPKTAGLVGSSFFDLCFLSFYKGGPTIIDSEFSVGIGRGVAENVFFVVNIIVEFLISVEDVNFSFAVFRQTGNLVWVLLGYVIFVCGFCKARCDVSGYKTSR